MLKKSSLLLIILSIQSSIFGQIKESPYETSFWQDGPWIASTLGANALGLYLIQTKDDLSLEKLNSLNKDDLWSIDRWAAGNNDERASKISDIPFAFSFVTPFLLTLHKDTRRHSGQLAVLMVESLSTASALFTLTAGLVEKSRPRVYSTGLGIDTRLSANNQRSFFSGHVAASAASTFFVAQVFSDFFPDSKAKPYIWTGAAVIPAVVGHFRIQSGNHFLSDVVLGYVVGAASGIFIPRLHRKKKNDNLQISPGLGFNGTQSLHFRYRF